MRLAFKFYYIHDNGFFTRLFYRNERLSIDGVNVVMGAITLGNE